MLNAADYFFAFELSALISVVFDRIHSERKGPAAIYGALLESLPVVVAKPLGECLTCFGFWIGFFGYLLRCGLDFVDRPLACIPSAILFAFVAVLFARILNYAFDRFDS